MTNEEARFLIGETENKLRRAYFSSPVVGWSLTSAFGASGFIFLSGWGVPLLAIAGGIGLWSVYVTEGNFKELQTFKDQKSLHIWRNYSQNGNLGAPLKGMALEIRNNIKEIYSMDGGEYLLPLSQAIRLFDIYIHQQKQRNPLNTRLCDLYEFRMPFTTKMAQLQALGETRAKSPEEQQLDAEIEHVKTRSTKSSARVNGWKK